MKPQDLMPGDLIIYLDTMGKAEHIAVFLGIKQSQPFVVHAVTDSYNSMMQTRLLPADPKCSYQVIRPKNFHLGLIALYYLNYWVEYQVPYSMSKMSSLEDKLDAIKGYSFFNKNAEQTQFRIASDNYQAYFKSCMQMMGSISDSLVMKDDKLDGLFCSEAVVKAFNLAYLSLHNLSKPGVSPRSRDRFDKESEYVTNQANNPMPLAAEDSMPAAISYFCSQSTHWQIIGLLDVPEKEFSESLALKYKIEWKECIKKLIHKAGILNNLLKDNRSDSDFTTCQSNSLDPEYLTEQAQNERKILIYATPIKNRVTRKCKTTPTSFFTAEVKKQEKVNRSLNFSAANSKDESKESIDSLNEDLGVSLKIG